MGCMALWQNLPGSLGPRCHLHGLTDTVNFPGPNQVINPPAPTSKPSAPCLTIAQLLETWLSSFALQ